jgi:hypothetical protein
MQIVDFTFDHIEQATALAKANYEEERQFVAVLPPVDILPGLTSFAGNGLGVAAFEDCKMIGFLCCCSLFNNPFGVANLKGVFSPLNAHGAVGKNRGKIYSKMYQAAAEKWACAGAFSHAIALYAHDLSAKDSFFNNGFGLRCVEAIRTVEKIDTAHSLKCEFCELKENKESIIKFKNLLNAHMNGSPNFMLRRPISEDALNKSNSRAFVAKLNEEIIAFIEISDNGESFVCDNKSMMNICGAYCLPQYRGTGVYNNLLAYLLDVLNSEWFKLIGVEFESFNPNARGFWLKHFTEYSNSVVRRIDGII